MGNGRKTGRERGFWHGWRGECGGKAADKVPGKMAFRGHFGGGRGWGNGRNRGERGLRRGWKGNVADRGWKKCTDFEGFWGTLVEGVDGAVEGIGVREVSGGGGEEMWLTGAGRSVPILRDFGALWLRAWMEQREEIGARGVCGRGRVEGGVEGQVAMGVVAQWGMEGNSGGV